MPHKGSGKKSYPPTKGHPGKTAGMAMRRRRFEARWQAAKAKKR